MIVLCVPVHVFTFVEFNSKTPTNRMHVREWLPNELYNLLSNSGLNIVYISQQENSVRCLQKKHPSEVNLGNQMFVIQNNNIKFIDQKVNKKPRGFMQSCFPFWCF